MNKNKSLINLDNCSCGIYERPYPFRHGFADCQIKVEDLLDETIECFINKQHDKINQLKAQLSSAHELLRKSKRGLELENECEKLFNILELIKELRCLKVFHQPLCCCHLCTIKKAIAIYEAMDTPRSKVVKLMVNTKTDEQFIEELKTFLNESKGDK